MNIQIAVVIVNRRILVWHLAELSGVVALIAELFHTHRNQRIVRHAMGQVLVNALIGQVESQYGTCPVTGLRGNLGILFPPGLRFTRPELLS